MQFDLLKILDEFREYCGYPIVIHGDFRENSERHRSGMAVDMHIVGLNVFDQFLLAERFGKFKGIGIYPCWNNKGLHVDIYKSGRWIAYNDGTGKQQYTALNFDNVKRYIF